MLEISAVHLQRGDNLLIVLQLRTLLLKFLAQIDHFLYQFFFFFLNE